MGLVVSVHGFVTVGPVVRQCIVVRTFLRADEKEEEGGSSRVEPLSSALPQDPLIMSPP